MKTKLTGKIHTHTHNVYTTTPGLARKLTGLDLLLSRPSGRGLPGLSQTAASLYRRVMLLTHTTVSLKCLWIDHERHT